MAIKVRPLSSGELRGNWATLLLPIRPDDSIDYGVLRAEASYFCESGVNGAYSNGTAGEFFAQSETEFDRVNQILAQVCERHGVPFQVGVSHMSPQVSLDRLHRARSLRPSAFQVILPDWYPPTMDDTHRFLGVMEAEAAPVGLVVYNPPHAKRRLTPQDWVEVVERHPGVIGVKVADGDASWYEAMHPVLEKVSVFVPGHHLATGLGRGARGAYSNVACLSPRGAQRWYELCLSDPTAGLALEARLVRFIDEHVAPIVSRRSLPNMGADKLMAVAGGWVEGMTTRIRWPYLGATQEEADRVGSAARAELPELFRD